MKKTIIILVLSCIFIGLASLGFCFNKTYTDAIKYSDAKDWVKAKEKIDYVYKIYPAYRDTKKHYNYITFWYGCKEGYRAFTKKDFERQKELFEMAKHTYTAYENENVGVLKEIDTFLYVGYPAIKGNEYLKNQDYNKAIEYLEKAVNYKDSPVDENYRNAVKRVLTQAKREQIYYREQQELISGGNTKVIVNKRIKQYLNGIFYNIVPDFSIGYVVWMVDDYVWNSLPYNKKAEIMSTIMEYNKLSNVKSIIKGAHSRTYMEVGNNICNFRLRGQIYSLRP